MTEKYGHIYQIENLVNGKKYIGQTINDRGYRDFPSGYKENKHLYRSYEKYGIKSFKITIINDAKNQKKLDKKEEFYIQKFNTLDCNFGYNMRHGGSKGKLTQKTKDLMSFNTIQKTFSKDYLEQEYLINKKPLVQIALENNCNTTSITRKLKEYNIPRKGNIKFSFTKNFLKQEYIVNKKNTYQIAKENNCSHTTIIIYLQKYNIPIRNMSEAHIKFYFFKKFLEQEYIVNKKTTHQIALENNCKDTTIIRNLRKYNIPRRKKGNTRRNIKYFFTRKFLEQEYLVNKKSMRQIAKENNCSISTIYNNLNKYNIPTTTY